MVPHSVVRHRGRRRAHAALRGVPGGAAALRFARWMLSGGIVLLILAALVVPQHVHLVLGLRHLHEALSRTAAIFFGLAMLACCLCAWRDRAGGRTLDPRLLPVWCALTVLPISGILISEA